MPRPDALQKALADIVPPLLTVLEALDWVARNIHPPDMPAVADAVASLGAPFARARKRFERVKLPPRAADLKACIAQSAMHAGRALGDIARAATDDSLATVFRAMGQRSRALAALYPTVPTLPPANRYFVERDRRGDEALLAKLAGADGRRGNVGVIHASNERDRGGGYSLYVPEYYDPSRRYPLICALHGGSGHGRDFLWTWLPTARTRGAILLSPTALGRTWSLDAPEADLTNIHAMVEHVAKQWRIDLSRRLLTGMSDGGTFCYLVGLRKSSPFTHLAPASASFNPAVFGSSGRNRLDGLRVYLVHGARDWMFSVETARLAEIALRATGAAVRYREIADLSHVWAREENARILDWLDATAAA